MKRNKYVKSPKHLRDGRYLRAFVNHSGDCTYWDVVVTGRPFMAAWVEDKKLLAMPLQSKSPMGKDRYYMNDLGGYPTETKKLYPFSNKMDEKLKSILKAGHKENRAFVEFLRGKPFTEHEWHMQKLEWESEREMDAALDRMFMDSLYD